MNLLELRKLFIKRSGRFDLVVDTTSWADNGADFFINAGQRFLDQFVKAKKEWGRAYVTIAAGDYYATFPTCRAIKECWALDSEGLYKLEKHDVSEMRQAYAEPASLIEQDTPTYYSPAWFRVIPDESPTPIGDTEMDTGTTIIDSFDDALGTAAIWEYVVEKDDNKRTGAVRAVWDDDTLVIKYIDTALDDLGDTSGVTFTVVLSSGNVELRCTVTSDGWTFKSIDRRIA